MSTLKVLAFADTHYGWERKNKKLKPIHNQRAINAMVEFAADYKPDVICAVGDLLDCYEVSHWNRNKPLNVEGMRLRRSFDACEDGLIFPLQEVCPKAVKKYVKGNHEAWLDELVQQNPALEGLIGVEEGLDLDNTWEVYEQGTVIKIGKLHFVHGENIGDGSRGAIAAVNDYECSIRYFHHHTLSAGTKNSPVDARQAKVGMSIPGLCNRAPGYGRRKPNRWIHGFLWGEVDMVSGYFTDHVTIITDKGFWLNGKHYTG